MAEIMYIGDGGAVTHGCIQTYRKALNLYQADVFDECASILRDVIKTNPPIFWKCTFLTMLCVVTEHWFRAERYRLHAEALWKLLDNNRAIHQITWIHMNQLRAELDDAYRWCSEGRPDDPEEDAKGVEEYWEEWGGKNEKEDFDTSKVGIGPAGTITRSENTSGTSMTTQLGSDTTITQSGNPDIDSNLERPSQHVRSKSEPTLHLGSWRSVPVSDNKRSLDHDHDGPEIAETKRAKQDFASANPSNTNVTVEDDAEEARTKPLEDNVEPKQSWYTQIARAMSPTKSTATKVSVTSAVHASTHSLLTPRPVRLHFGNASTASLVTPTHQLRDVQPLVALRSQLGHRLQESFQTTQLEDTYGFRNDQSRPQHTNCETRNRSWHLDHGQAIGCRNFSDEPNLKTPTASGTTNLPIGAAGDRAAGETVHQNPSGRNAMKMKKEQDSRKVKFKARDPFTPR